MTATVTRKQQHDMAKEAQTVQKVRRKEKKNISSGVAHVNASFNNTLITISDAQGNTIAWSSSGTMGFKGSRKSTPYAAQMAAEDAGKKAMEHGVRTDRSRSYRARFRPRVGTAGVAGGRLPGDLDPRRDADRPQRLPAAQASPRLSRLDNRGDRPAVALAVPTRVVSYNSIVRQALTRTVCDGNVKRMTSP